MSLAPFEYQDAGHRADIARVWTAACGTDFRVSESAVRFNTEPGHGVTRSGQLARVNGQTAGFVLVSAAEAQLAPWTGSCGWIDAIAVLPAQQRRGLGTTLLDWAETWLRSAGCTCATLGGSLRPFAPGLPHEIGSAAFFQSRAYGASGDLVWDIARRLRGYRAPAGLCSVPQDQIRSAKRGDEQGLRALLASEFAGRWLYEFDDCMAAKGAIEDYVVLETGGRIEGFCRVNVEGGWWPMDRFFPYRLPRPWGQLGPIGISQVLRGRGYGSALLNVGLLELQRRGIDGCIIDWTSQLAFYERFGFETHRAYLLLRKEMVSDGMVSDGSPPQT